MQCGAVLQKDRYFEIALLHLGSLNLEREEYTERLQRDNILVTLGASNTEYAAEAELRDALTDFAAYAQEAVLDFRAVFQQIVKSVYPAAEIGIPTSGRSIQSFRPYHRPVLCTALGEFHPLAAALMGYLYPL